MTKRNLFGAVVCAACAFVLAGCGSLSASSPSYQTRAFAFDTSGSAKDKHETFFNRGLHDMMADTRDTRLVVYRFDVLPQEAHEGDSFGNDEEVARLMKEVFTRTAGRRGTNLFKLFEGIDRRLPQWPQPVSIRVYTDCGTELMTKDEFARLLAMTRRWKANGSPPDLTFVGVETGFRETLRGYIGYPIIIE
ncbi:MAG: hypothetical protein ACR2HJ_10560 [Fimbriimonadales bacterium]